MPTFHRASPMPVPVDVLEAWHARPAAFERLAPPWTDVRVKARTGGITAGDLTDGTLTFAIHQGPLSLTWVADHGPAPDGRGFTDTQRSGPFARWQHVHRFLAGPDGTSILDDTVAYDLPGGPIGALVGGAIGRAEVVRMFAFRHARTALDLARLAWSAHRGPQRILISGASGLIGSALSAFWRNGGHEVVTLVRRAAGPGQIAWDPAAGRLDPAALEGFDVVVHLAGSNIGAGRWTPERKTEILASRVDGTRLLATALAGLTRKPRALLVASGAGYYGDRGDAPLTEADAGGTGFLADVCRAWEAAAAPARDAGIRTVHLRTGVVLAPRDGALAKMLPPFRLGLGGPIGSGQQVMSWVALEDVVGAYHHAAFDDALAGPVNLVAPGAVTSAAFAHGLGTVLHRPAFLPLPALAVEAAFGEMGRELLLQGQRAQPAKLEAAGFRFAFPDLEGALRHELGLPKALEAHA